MGLLDRVRGIRQEYQAAYEENVKDDWREFYEIAVRDYLDRAKDDDAARLYEIFGALELTDGDYEKTVRGVGRVIEAAASVDHFTEALEGHADRYAEAQRQMHICQGELKRSQRRVNELSRLDSALRGSESRLQDTRKEFPNLFDADGRPHTALSTLVKKRKTEMKKQAADREKAADQKIDTEVQSTIQRLGLAD